MPGAKVTAIDAVEGVAVSLRCFQEDALAALDELQMEVNRALDWIQNDRPSYWREAVRRGWDAVSEARTQLEQARFARRIADYEPVCREEQKALEKAQQRLQLAQEKMEAVRHWCHVVEKAIIEFRGGVGQLARWLEADLPRALAALQHMIAALDSYLATAAPEIALPADLLGGGTQERAAVAGGEAEELQPQRPAEGQVQPAADGTNVPTQLGEPTP
jgi:hypothetical protein